LGWYGIAGLSFVGELSLRLIPHLSLLSHPFTVGVQVR
jgi:hypothetical protein